MGEIVTFHTQIEIYVWKLDCVNKPGRDIGVNSSANSDSESGSHSVLRNSDSDLCNEKIDRHLLIITIFYLTSTAK